MNVVVIFEFKRIVNLIILLFYKDYLVDLNVHKFFTNYYFIFVSFKIIAKVLDLIIRLKNNVFLSHIKKINWFCY